MTGVAQGFLVILGIIFAGYVASRAGIVRGKDRLVLNRVAFYVATPALLFGVLQNADPATVLSPVIVISAASAVLTAALYVAASRLWFPRDHARTVIGAATSGYVNANNLGLPVAIYILGDAAYVAPLLVVQLICFSPLILGSLERAKNSGQSVLRTVFKTFLSPIVLASLSGFALSFSDWKVPEIVMTPIDMIGAASIPLVLLSFGVSLYGQRALSPGPERVEVVTASVLKLLVMPALTLAVTLMLDLTPHEVFVTTTIAALPTAQNVYNFAATYGRGEVQARDTVFVTTFASLAVIAVIALTLGVAAN